MQPISNATFGPLIAYLVPGLTVLVGIREFTPLLPAWFAEAPSDAPTIGGFLYLTMAALAAGMTVSAVRWALVDTLHAKTGLRAPPLDFSHLGEKVEGFALLIRIHYEHYQFYANMFVAAAIGYGCHRIGHGDWARPVGSDAVFLILEAIFFAASRDTLGKYHTRCRQLLGVAKPRRAK